MGKIRPPRRPAKAPLEAVAVKDAQGVAVGKIWRPKAVGVKDAQGVAVIAIDGQSVPAARMVAPARCGKKGLLLEDGIAVCRMDAPPVISTTQKEAVGPKDAKGVAAGKIWRPWRPAKAPLGAVGVKNAKGAAVITVDGEVVVSVLGVPAVVATRGKEGSLEDGVAVCQMDALVGASVIAKARHEGVRLKGAKGVAAGKMWQPRQPAKAPLEAVEVKDTKGVAVITVYGEVEASVLGAPVVMAAGGKEKRSPEDGIAVCQMDTLDGAPVISTTRKEAVGLKDAKGVVVGKMWRPRRPVKTPLEAVRVKDVEGVAVITVNEEVEVSVLGAPVVMEAGGKEKRSLEDGIAVCQMDALDGAPVISTTRKEAVGLKDAKGVVVGKMWRPRRPVKTPLEAVRVKDVEGVAVITVNEEVEVSVLGAPVVMEAGGKEKRSLEDGIAVCQMDALDGAPVISTTRKEAVGLKDAKGVVVGKMWRPRRPVKTPLEAVRVKDVEGVAVITVNEEVEVSVLGAPVVMEAGGKEKRSLEDGIAVCQMDALDGAPVISTTRKEAVGLKDAKGVVVGKMWRPRRPVKTPLEAVRVKDVEGVAVITVNEEVEVSVLGAPVVMEAGGKEKRSLEDGIAVCQMDALDGAPVIAPTQQEAVGLKDAKGVRVGKKRRPRRPAKAPFEGVRVKDAEGVVVIAVDEEVEASVLGAQVVTTAEGGDKGSLEDGTAVSGMDALDGAPVIAMTRQEIMGLKNAKRAAVGKMRRPRQPAKAPLEVVGVKDAEGIAVIDVDGKVEASVLGAQVVTTAEGGDKGSLEDGTAVSGMDALDGAPVIAMTRQEIMGLKNAKRAAVGKMRRPRQPAKAPLEVVGVKDAEGIAVIDVDGKVEALVLGAPVVTVDGGIEKGPLDTLDGAPVISTTQHEAVGLKDVEGVAVITVDGEVEAPVLGVPVVAAARGGEKGSLEDGMTVCRRETFEGAPVIATDEKSEVSMQGDPVVPSVDQKVDAPVVEAVQAITMKGNGKEKEEGIKWLKHYSTAQSILIVGDGDFSFSLALATTFGSGGNLVATSLDSYGALTRKYAKAESNVRELKRLGATVLHGVDAKTMKLHSYLETRRFDRIVFNFPHAGFKGKEDHLHVITAHKQLVHGFLANAWQLLRPYGETHISHKTGFPYDAWHIEQLAYESCLIMVRKVGFSKEDYPGYNQKRGDGATCDESFPLGRCCTYMFCVGDVEKLKQARGNRVGSISSYLGDSKFYPGISATDMMWPFDLHPAWPQPHFPPVHMPIAFDPCPCGVAEMEHPANCYGISFHHQDMVQPTTHQEQPWYQGGPLIEPPWTPQKYQSLQREYEIHRQLTLPLEDCYMESVQRQAMLEMLIQVYGRQ